MARPCTPHLTTTTTTVPPPPWPPSKASCGLPGP
jgi:hypothetical protein